MSLTLNLLFTVKVKDLYTFFITALWSIAHASMMPVFVLFLTTYINVINEQQTREARTIITQDITQITTYIHNWWEIEEGSIRYKT